MSFYANGMGYALTEGEGPDKFYLEACPEFDGDIASHSSFDLSIHHPGTKNGGYACLDRDQAKDLAQAINNWLEQTDNPDLIDWNS